MIIEIEATRVLIDKIHRGSPLSPKEEQLFLRIQNKYKKGIKQAFTKWFSEGRLRKLLVAKDHRIYQDLEADMWIGVIKEAKKENGISENFFNFPEQYLYNFARNTISNFSAEIEALYKETNFKSENSFESADEAPEIIEYTTAEICEQKVLLKQQKISAREKYITSILKEKEIRILELEAEGLTQEQIAQELGISIKTVYNYKQSAQKKTKKHNQVWLDEMDILNN